MALQTNECERYTIDERKEKNLVKDKNLKVGSRISLLRQRGGDKMGALVLSISKVVL